MNLPIPWMGKDPLYKGGIPAVPGWYAAPKETADSKGSKTLATSS